MTKRQKNVCTQNNVKSNSLFKLPAITAQRITVNAYEHILQYFQQSKYPLALTANTIILKGRVSKNINAEENGKHKKKSNIYTDRHTYICTFIRNMKTTRKCDNKRLLAKFFFFSRKLCLCSHQRLLENYTVSAVMLLYNIKEEDATTQLLP